MNPPMDCPRCGQPAVADPICPRCGVIVAKARPRSATPAAISMHEDAPDEARGPSGFRIMAAAALLVMAGAVGSRQWDRLHRRPQAAREAAGVGGSRPVEARMGQPIEGPPPSLTMPVEVPLQGLHAPTSGVSDADRGRADDLIRRLANPASMTAVDVQAAEDLLARHEGDKAPRDILEAVLLSAA